MAPNGDYFYKAIILQIKRDQCYNVMVFKRQVTYYLAKFPEKLEDWAFADITEGQCYESHILNTFHWRMRVMRLQLQSLQSCGI